MTRHVARTAEGRTQAVSEQGGGSCISLVNEPLQLTCDGGWAGTGSSLMEQAERCTWPGPPHAEPSPASCRGGGGPKVRRPPALRILPRHDTPKPISVKSHGLRSFINWTVAWVPAIPHAPPLHLSDLSHAAATSLSLFYVYASSLLHPPYHLLLADPLFHSPG